MEVRVTFVATTREHDLIRDALVAARDACEKERADPGCDAVGRAKSRERQVLYADLLAKCGGER